MLTTTTQATADTTAEMTSHFDSKARSSRPARRRRRLSGLLRAAALTAGVSFTMLSVGASTAGAAPVCATARCDVLVESTSPNLVYIWDYQHGTWALIDYQRHYANVYFLTGSGWAYLGYYRYGTTSTTGTGSGFMPIGTLGNVPIGVGASGSWATAVVQDAWRFVQGVPTVCGTGQCPKGLGR